MIEIKRQIFNAKILLTYSITFWEVFQGLFQFKNIRTFRFTKLNYSEMYTNRIDTGT